MPHPSTPRSFETRLAAALPRLEVFVRARLGTVLAQQHEPLDVVQDVLAEAWSAKDQFVEPDAAPGARCPLAAWLCRLAERRIVDLARRARRLKRPPAEARVAMSALVDAHRASQTGPVSAAARAEAHARLTAALGGLDTMGLDDGDLARDARAALLARHFEGLTLEEIAARLGRSEAGVRRLLGRAHAALGAALRGFDAGTEA